jgi:hypothetical protein
MRRFLRLTLLQSELTHMLAAAAAAAACRNAKKSSDLGELADYLTQVKWGVLGWAAVRLQQLLRAAWRLTLCCALCTLPVSNAQCLRTQLWQLKRAACMLSLGQELCTCCKL